MEEEVNTEGRLDNVEVFLPSLRVVSLQPNAISVKPSNILNDISRTTHLITVLNSCNFFDKFDLTIRLLTVKNSKLIKKAGALFATFLNTETSVCLG